ncbi:hypothetical protein CLU79DRAFT_358385 [Phycomyces nitens]|nr:hypothetical protein CLU79DRAFT_358385 [Phycomyces nitens]
MANHAANASSTANIGTKQNISLTDQNDIKKLRSNYGSSLNILREMFSDWSDEDLLFAIRDADGDLELAVNRISEGHCTQWGEVKTRKSKKEAKPKENTVSASQPLRDRQDRTSRQPIERSLTERRSGKTTGKLSSTGSTRQSFTSGSQQHQAQAWSRSKQEPSFEQSTWAFIASNGSRTVDTPESSGWQDSSDAWSAPPSKAVGSTTTTTSTITTSSTTTTTTSTLTSSATYSSNSQDAPKTWASLLKPKQEPVQPDTIVPKEQDANKTKQEPRGIKEIEAIKAVWGTTVEIENPWSDNTLASPTVHITEQVIRESTKPIDALHEETKLRQPVDQLLKQDSPVILPSNEISDFTASSLFENLRIDDDVQDKETLVSELVDLVSEPRSVNHNSCH